MRRQLAWVLWLKSFQNGRQRLEDAGLYVSSLCKVASLKGNKVTLFSVMKNFILSVQHLLAMYAGLFLFLLLWGQA